MDKSTLTELRDAIVSPYLAVRIRVGKFALLIWLIIFSSIKVCELFFSREVYHFAAGLTGSGLVAIAIFAFLGVFYEKNRSLTGGGTAYRFLGFPCAVLIILVGVVMFLSKIFGGSGVDVSYGWWAGSVLFGFFIGPALRDSIGATVTPLTIAASFFSRLLRPRHEH